MLRGHQLLNKEWAEISSEKCQILNVRFGWVILCTSWRGLGAQRALVLQTRVAKSFSQWQSDIVKLAQKCGGRCEDKLIWIFQLIFWGFMSSEHPPENESSIYIERISPFLPLIKIHYISILVSAHDDLINYSSRCHNKQMRLRSCCLFQNEYTEKELKVISGTTY